ncbi:hypothetical protein [Jiella sp. M17.18]|uniref:hypothetical protein n=1 Tax=Jiella sp. M17.18 TaxID=3234247 RepID=UPI0034DFFC09
MASAIETSLRRALNKGNAADPDFRLRVYEAAERALLRLEADKGEGDEGADAHRRQLIAAIEAIEADHAAGGAGEGVQPERFAPDGGSSAGAAAPGAFAAGGVDDPVDAFGADGAPARPAGGRMPSMVDPQTESSSAEERVAGPGDRRAKVRALLGRRSEAGGARGGFGSYIVPAVIVLLLLFLLGVAVWLVLPLFSAEKPKPEAPKMSVEDAIRSADNGRKTVPGAASDWVDVFSGPAIVDAAVDGGMLQPTVIDGKQAVLVSTPPSGSNEVTFNLAPDILSRFAGRKATGELAVGSPDGKPRTFTVRCLIGGKNVCGQQRFTTSAKEEPVLVQMDLPASIGEGAELAIDPGAGDGAHDLAVFHFRIRAAG